MWSNTQSCNRLVKNVLWWQVSLHQYVGKWRVMLGQLVVDFQLKKPEETRTNPWMNHDSWPNNSTAIHQNVTSVGCAFHRRIIFRFSHITSASYLCQLFSCRLIVIILQHLRAVQRVQFSEVLWCKFMKESSLDKWNRERKDFSHLFNGTTFCFLLKSGLMLC